MVHSSDSIIKEHNSRINIMGFEEYFQPPFSVFFLWALFLCVIVLFQPIRFVVKRCLQCMGCSLCANADVEESDDERRMEDDK